MCSFVISICNQCPSSLKFNTSVYAIHFMWLNVLVTCDRKVFCRDTFVSLKTSLIFLRTFFVCFNNKLCLHSHNYEIWCVHSLIKKSQRHNILFHVKSYRLNICFFSSSFFLRLWLWIFNDMFNNIPIMNDFYLWMKQKYPGKKPFCHTLLIHLITTPFFITTLMFSCLEYICIFLLICTE
jgi:hypothetical protein